MAIDRMRAELARAFAGMAEKAVEALVGEAVKDVRTRRRTRSPPVGRGEKQGRAMGNIVQTNGATSTEYCI